MAAGFALVPAAYLFLIRAGRRSSEDEVLLQLRAGTGYMDDHWAAAVAGHVERGESVFAAALREAGEEIRVCDVVLLPLCAMHRTGNGDAIDERTDYFFTARQWSGDPRVLEPDKCAALAWFPLDALPAPVVPHELVVLEAIRGGTVQPILSYGFLPAADDLT